MLLRNRQLVIIPRVYNGSLKVKKIAFQRSMSVLNHLPRVTAAIPPSFTGVHRLIQNFEDQIKNFKGRPESNMNQIFANNHLKLSSIDVVGFDYDYTLCHYNDEMQRLIYAMGRDFMVQKLRYPEGISALEFDPTFAIRGLTIDKQKGLLCKISSHQKLAYTGVYRGRQRLSRDEVLKIYHGSRHISIDYRDSNMLPLNDLFSVAHACLFADVVQYLIDMEIEFEPIAIVEDVNEAIKQVHLAGKMHKTVAQNPEKYIEPNSELLPLLQRLRSSGKKLFLCTNSTFPYIDAGLKFMLKEYEGNWRDLFDVTIVSARKPNFYTRHRAFRLLDADQKQVQWNKVTKFEKSQIYTQGSLMQFGKLTGWVGNRVLYIGDSLFSDLVEPSRINGWRTGAIIRELDDEIEVQHTERYHTLAFQVTALENLMRDIQNELRHIESTISSETEVRQSEFDNSVFVGQLVEIHEQLQTTMEAMIQPNFGSVFRADNNPSQFAFSVQRYVDIYSARLENFLHYPENYSFYPYRVGLPHEQYKF